MNYKDFNLGDWIGHISGAIEDERELDGNEMRDLVVFLSGLPKWIPVSERLPETTDNVLVSDSYHDVFVAWCQNRGGSRWWNSEDMTYSAGVPILAWMPLPEPYKAESEE